MSFLRSKHAPWLLIVALGSLAYWRVLQCGYIWDDDDYVTNNPVLRTWGGLARIWFEPTSLPQYYPLVHTSFWLEFRIWGLWATGYHVVNVALHGLSAWLLLRLGRRLAIPGIWFASLWFLVHPVHVESVAWITERKNVLSLVCYLFAAERWFCWHDDGGRRKDYVIGSVWLLGALWSKTITASLPAALLLVVWWRDGRITRRAVLGALPWFVVGAALGWFTVHLEATHVGAADAPWQLVGAERVLVAGRAVWFYLESLLLPFGCCFNYPRWQVDTGSLLQCAAPIGALLLVIGLWALRGRIGRAPAAVLLIFGGTLVPAVGFFDVYPFRYSFVADHFQYHASLAVLVGAAALGERLLVRVLEVPVRIAFAGAWLGVMTFMAQGLVPQYRDYETLWTETLSKNPESALALVNLGGLATDRGDANVARAYLERGLAIDATNHEARINLGVLEQRAGNSAAARRLYDEALRWKPDSPFARNNLAVLAITEGDPKAGLALVEEALAIRPDYYDAHDTAGWALCELKQWRRALRELDWVPRRTPDAHVVRLRVVRCMLALREPSTAAGNAMFVLSRQPQDGDARKLLATALGRLLRATPVDRVRDQAILACRNGGVDPAPILPLVADELLNLGESARAEVMAAGR